MHWANSAGSWTRETVAVLGKELRTEWRTRVAVSAVGLFTVGSLALMIMAFQTNPPVALDGQARASVATALLWTLLLFTAATGLGRAFVQEEERGTGLALRLSARATTVWTGKFFLNALLQTGLALLATPLLLSGLKVLNTGQMANFGLLASVIGLGNIGIAAVFTMTSALVAQASAKGGLLAALSFPILVPLFLAAVHGTRAALGVGAEGAYPDFARGAGDLQALGSYAVVSVTASLLIFDLVWNE